MKYFKELSAEDQEAVLTKLQPLPLFKHAQEDARKLLLTSDLYLIDDKLVVHSLAGKDNNVEFSN